MAEQGSAYTLPPIAIFPDATLPHPMPCLEAEARDEATRLAAVLAVVPAFGTAAERASGLRAATLAAARLVRALPTANSSTKADGLPARSPVQSYFRVRTAVLTAAQAAQQAALVIHRGLADLCDAPLSGSDIARETTAMRQLVVDLAGSEDSPKTPEDGGSEASDTSPGTGQGRQEEMWLSRWITGHHVHVLFNVYATIALREAVERLREGAVREATAQIERTTVYVQGFAAARAHAAALPADFYNTTIRPTMVPTVVPVPLSGSMHMEYREYRNTIDDLLAVLPDPIEDLALREPGLAFAREALLEADLIEAERHVCLVEPVVGSERSLVQPPATMDNAVSVLRVMRHARAAKIASLVRFGDHLVATAAKLRQKGGDSAAEAGRCPY
ncbi:hypothetical protein FCH28_13745 [Streptomyces piniterrae]|uniref:Uncharacterized protein n=1 Tax=Streptomyces piniterrae TaxID=2571125 RepID=A0A4V5MKQ8_9ACTN|nr:hypothetical protein [Streptomyces piniterrae]TJZ54238.1 hypothetical protein FCH28_13745 [Streptomyces piniterrae]